MDTSSRKGSSMTLPSIDWNHLWQETLARKDAHLHDPKFWDKRAPEFTRHATASDYIGQFMRIMNPEPHWTVLDVGSGAGTLAVPLAPSVKAITAIDSSKVMLSLLDKRCGENGIGNITAINGRWEDDWDELGIPVHDVAIASRSLIMDDLREAVLKLESRARKRVYISTLVDDGPYDRKVIEAVGRDFFLGADYTLVYNLLRQLGIYANIAFTVNARQQMYKDLDDALNSMRWMIYEMTPDEENRLREYLSATLIRENGHWRMPYRRIERWAVIWWEKEL